MRISPNGIRMLALYAHFGKDCANLDWSDRAIEEFYTYDSSGLPAAANNGFTHGKAMFGISVSMWVEDIRGGEVLTAREVLEDPALRPWKDIIRDIFLGYDLPIHKEFSMLVGSKG